MKKRLFAKKTLAMTMAALMAAGMLAGCSSGARKPLPLRPATPPQLRLTRRRRAETRPRRREPARRLPSSSATGRTTRTIPL